MAQPILVTEGDVVTYTITVKRAGSAVNLTPYASVVFYAHDDDSAVATNQVNGVSCTVTDAANGICTIDLTATHTALASGKTSFKGKWAVRLTTTVGSKPEWTAQEPFEIRKNPFAT